MWIFLIYILQVIDQTTVFVMFNVLILKFSTYILNFTVPGISKRPFSFCFRNWY